MAYLEIRNACVHYPVRNTWGTTGEFIRAVDDVSLSLEKGGILGLVGESGCGKSTLSRAIMQLQPLTTGSIILGDTNLSALSAGEIRRRRKDFQMVFQDPYASLNPRMSIFATLAEALNQGAKLKKSEQEHAVAELMQRVGLSPEHMYKYPHEFSGGQRQRIAIARAIAPRPALLLADEPVSALDVSIQSQILNLLTDLTKQMNISMIFISHDLSVVHYIADHIAVMQRGKIVEYGTADDVFRHPQHDYTKSLLAAIPYKWQFGEHKRTEFESPIGR